MAKFRAKENEDEKTYKYALYIAQRKIQQAQKFWPKVSKRK